MCQNYTLISNALFFIALGSHLITHGTIKMDILIQILEVLKGLSGPVLWVGLIIIVCLFTFKIVVVGSIYGVIKYAIEKTHSAITQPKHKRKIIAVEEQLDGITLTAGSGRLLAVVSTIRRPTLDYIHEMDIAWLESAIEEKKLRDEAAKTPTPT